MKLALVIYDLKEINIFSISIIFCILERYLI